MKKANAQPRLVKKCKLLLFICIFYYLVTWFTGCPIRFLFGIPCPGCGITRAWLFALRLDFAQAFSYHPLFLLAPLFPVYFLLEEQPAIRRYQWHIGILAGVFLLVWFLRLPFGSLAAQLRQGFLFRTFFTYRKLATGNLSAY